MIARRMVRLAEHGTVGLMCSTHGYDRVPRWTATLSQHGKVVAIESAGSQRKALAALEQTAWKRMGGAS